MIQTLILPTNLFNKIDYIKALNYDSILKIKLATFKNHLVQFNYEK